MIGLLNEEDPEGEPHETSLVSQSETEIVARVIERKTGTAQSYRLLRRMFDAPEYAGFVKMHAELKAMAGTPPFDVVLGKRDALALSFEDLRTRVLAVARDGVPLQRFKGLGEMNADQLGDTTMNPATRTLAKVNVDDAAAASELFSMLMGDQVEPRREFIEENARLVSNLDV